VIIICIRGCSDRVVQAQFTVPTSSGPMLIQGTLRYGENYELDTETGRLELQELNQFDA
jgi:hypothetical protein